MEQQEHCKLLRTKMSYVPNASVKDPLQQDSATRAYWCLKTMTPAGPDQGLAVPERCNASRQCFESLNAA